MHIDFLGDEHSTGFDDINLPLSLLKKTLNYLCGFLLQGQIQRQLNWLEADLIKVKSVTKQTVNCGIEDE